MELPEYVGLYGEQNEQLIRHALLFYRHNLHATSKVHVEKEKEYIANTVDTYGYGKLKTKDGVIWSSKTIVFQVRFGEDKVFIDTFRFTHDPALEHEHPGHLLRLLDNSYSSHQAATEAAVKLIDEKIGKLKTIKENFLAKAS